MKKQRQLLIGRAIFTLIVFVALGVIVITEKFGDLRIPKIEKKINQYIEEKYKEEKEHFQPKKITFKNTKYTQKILSKENKNLYFYIYYTQGKITDTYKTDYLEGKSLFKKIQKNLKKEIETTTNNPCEIEIVTTLNDFTTVVQKQIIEENNLKQLKFYTLKKELLILNWNEKDITEKIIDNIEIYQNQNITPKNYTFIITNKKDITESIEIQNITEEFQNNPSKQEIIKDIINDKNSNLLKQNKITYKYLN